MSICVAHSGCKISKRAEKLSQSLLWQKPETHISIKSNLVSIYTNTFFDALISKMKLIFFYFLVEVDISLLLKWWNCYIWVAAATLMPFAEMSDCRSYSKSQQQAEQHCNNKNITFYDQNSITPSRIVTTTIPYKNGHSSLFMYQKCQFGKSQMR